MGYLEMLANANCVDCGIKGTVGNDRCDICYNIYMEARFDPNMTAQDLTNLWKGL